MEKANAFTVEKNPNFFKLWSIRSVQRWREEDRHLKDWPCYEIYAKTTRDIDMRVWNGRHPVESNTSIHTCKTGSRVRVWMVSRFGDVGITDNLENPNGYDARGVDADTDLVDYEFIERE